MIPRDSHVTAPAEIRRLMTDNERVLALLKRGPCSATELAQQATFKYTQRISDLRDAGYDIKFDKVDKVYRLIAQPSVDPPSDAFDANQTWNLS